MLGPFIAIVLPILLFGIIRMLKDPLENLLMRVLLAGYVARMFYATVLVDLPIFSYGSGGDSIGYTLWAKWIAASWKLNGVHYVGRAELFQLGPTTLPPNIYAVMHYLGGDDGARAGNTAIVAFTACLTCLNFYRLSIELGVPMRRAFWVMSLWFFSPAFFLYTSDTYKDGLVLFFVLTAFASSIRLSQRFTLLHAVIGALATAALYGCRYYLVFVVVTPLLVSFIGFGSKSVVRPVVGIGSILVVAVWLLAFTTTLEQTEQEANDAFEVGENGIQSNSTGGSGVTFDDGGKPTGALGLKLLYTLFSPFPWTTGSFALQLGKIEAIMWYYFVYRAFIAGRRLVKEDRALLVQFLIFIVPTSFSYATIMSNIGLIVRERMGIVMVGTLLGSLSWATPKKKALADQALAIHEAEVEAAVSE